MDSKYIQRISLVIILSLAVSLLVLWFMTSHVLAIVPGVNERISLRSTGSQALAASGQPYISANGKKIVYQSSDTNILPSGGAGIFLRDIPTGTLTRVSVSTAGTLPDDLTNTSAKKISATGRYILFSSQATNLIDGVTLSSSLQLYLRDTKTSTTTLITKNPSTGNASASTSNVDNEAIGVSSDGRFIAFMSNAVNLNTDSSDGKYHLYMLDRSDNTLSIIDRKLDGTVASTSPTYPPRGSMSCDGSLIVFQYGVDLTAESPAGGSNIYLLDRRGNEDKISNLTSSANYESTSPSISCNGDYVAFRSTATNLDTSKSISYVYNAYRPYVYDRVDETYHLVAVSTSNTGTNTSVCGTLTTGLYPCVTPSDTGVAVFAATDSSLTGTSGSQIYIRNIHTNSTELVSRNTSGTAANGSAGFSSISADGGVVVYSSGATNLVSGDTNGQYDVFTSLTGY